LTLIYLKDSILLDGIFLVKDLDSETDDKEFFGGDDFLLELLEFLIESNTGVDLILCIFDCNTGDSE
jgi:hypothetical protein